MGRKKFIVLGVTGGIAAYKACDIAGYLVKEGCEVQALLTREGREFITPLSLQTMSRNKVVTDMFESPEAWDPAHISIADRADLVMIAPATANVIAKLAAGICDDMLTCVACATKAPVLVAPAMNDNMYANPIVKSNIERLKKAGYRFVGPVRGRLACGREGIGHMADVCDIVKQAKRLIN